MIRKQFAPMKQEKDLIDQLEMAQTQRRERSFALVQIFVCKPLF
jgi:hypothetical protein